LAQICHTSATVDSKTVDRRVKDEGLSFLTITLPKFGAAFTSWLDNGQIDISSQTSFGRKRSGLPRFLAGFLCQIFDTSGVLLDQPSFDAIDAVRQLTTMFAKMEYPCTPARDGAALRSYVEIDQVVRRSANATPNGVREDFRRVAALLFGSVASTVDDLVHRGEISGKHGPGSTADHLRGNLKWSQTSWTERLEEEFPFLEHVLPSVSYWRDAQHADYLSPGDELPVRVITVPKTPKAPRIIAVEPTCMQYMQQAISTELVKSLEPLSPNGDDGVFGMIGFRDQIPNREMARKGSMDGSLATLDLSDASDRVSVQHVEDLFHRFPSLLKGVLSVRSTKAEVRGHGVIPLAKYASMGSALTFPLEAMVFLTAVFLGIEKALGQPLTRRTVRDFAARVRVYGDDIVVPAALVYDVISQLETLGLKVNVDKSFWNGKFRESCGGDYYDGRWVTPIRVRQSLPESRVDTKEMIAAVSLRNQCYFAGYWKTAKWLDGMLAGMLVHFPTVHPSSSLLGRHTVLPIQWDSVSKSTQSPIVRGWVVRSRPPESVLNGWGALRKCLSPGRVEPFQDPEHLLRQGRDAATGLILRWRPPTVVGGDWVPSSTWCEWD